MKNYFSNIGYFLKETKTIIQLNFISNIFSIFSIGLIFFILTMMLSAWWVSNEIVNVIQNEAEISVYFHENFENSQAIELVEKIKGINGVEDARLVDEDEAYSRMAEVLDTEAGVLEFFDYNPFSSFIEIKINLEQLDGVLENLSTIKDIQYVRDNKEVLNKISSISEILRILGYLFVVAAGISTVVIISHIIKMGIYNNREQINTLRLLGAPEIFISLPYLIEGLLLTVGGGVFAVILSTFIIEYTYEQITGPLPFIPLPPKEILVSNLIYIVMSISSILGIVGSLIGLVSAKKE